jgi:hypothetical protein
MIVRRAPRAIQAFALLTAVGGCTAAHGAPIVSTPPRAELERAWRGIDDPQLAAQLRPGRPFDAVDCVVHLGVFHEQQATPAQRNAIERASQAWRAEVVRESDGVDEYAEQMIGSSVNPLADTPPLLRQAAAAWCVAHAPD